MPIQIRNIDELLVAEEAWIQLDIPFESAFKPFNSRRGDRGFLEPAVCLKHLLIWIWLSAHRNTSDDRILGVASQIIRRSFGTYERAEGQSARGEHDLFLLSAAIVVGDQTLIHESIRRVAYAGETDSPVFYAACCGMLKARIMGEKEMERRQFDLFMRYKGKSASMYRVASRANYQAFVENRDKSVVQQSHKACEAFWERLEDFVFPDALVVLPEDQRRWNFPEPFNRDHGRLRLESPWSVNAYWPWPELTLLKLAVPDCKLAHSDSFWIPPQLLNLRRK